MVYIWECDLLIFFSKFFSSRLFSEQRTELYVCYQENTSQDMIEMAFRLLFGWIA